MGSFGNMYVSIENLSATYLQPNVTKESHLKLKVYIFETGDSLSYCQTLNHNQNPGNFIGVMVVIVATAPTTTVIRTCLLTTEQSILCATVL